MDWNNNNNSNSGSSNILRNSSFVSHPSEISSSSSNLLYNFNQQFGRFSGLEAKQHLSHPLETMMMAPTSIIVPPSMEMVDHMIQMSYGISNNNNNNNNNNNQEKMKKRLTANQLESLESSFQEEKKLDPDRKMKLARDLGLQPRQVAVWFQNRRARWKNKKLEHLYDALKHDFDIVSKEKQMLQEEVKRLKCMLKEQATSNTKKQVCSGYTEASCEETTLESTSSADRNINIKNTTNNEALQAIIISRELNKVGGHYHHLFNHNHNNNNNNVDVYSNNNVVSPSYWGALA